MAAGDSPLTAREADLLSRASDGAPVADIARRAFLAPGTVRDHLSSAVAKLTAGNRHIAAHIAAHIARSHGWI
ncbi:helix-turn-helix domain-containing protein [Nocardiopsis baichengensis]|uniref:helix-turn-helix domain-containing protein n=1 Tax=Nocardiopsis baichengensis TaxID=280240 RepID=UPI0009FD3806